MKNLRSHGMESNRNDIDEFGHVSRMDNLQAAVLNFRFKNLKSIINKRRKNVNLYLKYLDKKHIFFPNEIKEEYNTYHTFVIQVDKRKKLINYLSKKGIGTAIHYPIPIHLQRASRKYGYKVNDFPFAEKQSKRILTLPINQYLTQKQIIYICDSINKFYRK